MATGLKAPKKPQARSKRFEFRVTKDEQALIHRAAAEKGMKMAGFVVESACTAAKAVLADQRHFELTPAQFAEFTSALDRPARAIPAVRKLLAERSVIERDRERAATL